MRYLLAPATATLVLLLAGCVRNPGVDPGPTTVRSGVEGTVTLAPQCPVETQDTPCPPEPAAGVRVTVSRQQPGEAYGAGPVVAESTTDQQGGFRIPVLPGDYVVTAEAGMSCEFMDVTIPAQGFASIAVPCDTGIR